MEKNKTFIQSLIQPLKTTVSPLLEKPSYSACFGSEMIARILFYLKSLTMAHPECSVVERHPMNQDVKV